MRTSQNIKAEIEDRFGFFPPFFEPALRSAEVLDNLWQQTLSAYIENPLSALFKEKLNALLSRYCVAPYCMMVHSAALRPLGMTAREVLTLLDAPSPETGEADLPLGVLPVPSSEEAIAPAPGSPLEQILLYCATVAFLEQANIEACQTEMRRLLGPELYPHLVAYLAYIKTCHIWIQAHPDVSYEADRRAVEHLGPLLAEEPALADFFSNYQERVAGARESRATQAAVEAERARSVRRTEGILESITDAFFALDRDWRFTYINGQAERLLRRTRQELMGRSIWDEFPEAQGTAFEQQYRLAVAERESISFEQFYPPLSAWFEVHAYPSSDGLSVYFHDIGTRKAMQAEQVRLADANRLLLDSTSEGVYGVDAAGLLTFVNRAAARMLGYTPMELLGCDGHALFHHSRPDGTPYPVEECPIHRAVSTGKDLHVEADVFWRRDGTSFPVAFTAAPMTEGDAVRGAVITFSDITERKAMEVERAQIADREHRIAAQLQDALRPELPGTVPGLAVTKYYEAALTEEAGVGGDFYDVFLLGNGRTALVVGDLSGKGLAAAAQVATVRNMLRAFLYSKPTVAEAVTDLNRVLAENELLTGFSTLFVGAYDDGTGVLNFVNCGQEPALVRRGATGAVEQLMPTGPILGALENVRYGEEAVTLVPGDALAIFTDGVTEVGPSRTAMLGMEGVIALLGQPIALEEVQHAADLAETVAARLIEGVDAAAAGGVMRDDVCLLVAVVDSP